MDMREQIVCGAAAFQQIVSDLNALIMSQVAFHLSAYIGVTFAMLRDNDQAAEYPSRVGRLMSMMKLECSSLIAVSKIPRRTTPFTCRGGW